MIFVPSRFDVKEEKTLVDALANNFRSVFARLAAPDLTFETDTFTDLTIPYIAYYSFVEELVTRDRDSTSPAALNLKKAYENICRTLAQLDPTIRAKMREEVDDPSKVNVAEQQERLAERAYSKFTPNEQQLARSLFTRLVRLALPEEGERKDTPKDVKLSDLSLEQQSIATVLEKEGLLVIAKDAAGQETVGLAEENLIQNWKRFKQWIDEDREFLIWRQKLQTSISDWEKAGRDNSYLLKSSRYVEAEAWFDRYQIELNRAETEYIKASLSQRKRERLQSYAQVAGLILGVLGLIFTIYTFWQRNSNSPEEIRSRQLASKSEDIVTLQPELSTLVAIEALRLAPTTEGQQALKKALQQSHFRTLIDVGATVYSARYIHDGRRILTGSGDDGNSLAQIWQQGGSNNWQNLVILRGHKGRVTSAAFSPDNRLVATSSYDGTVIFWDIASGEMTGKLELPPPQPFIKSLADIDWSPDGTLVATANMADNQVYVWDIKTRQYRTLSGFNSDTMSVSFSPDGEYLAAGSKDKQEQVRIWDVQSGQEARPPLVGHTGGVFSVRFSRDGKFLVTAGEDNTARVWTTSEWRTVAVLSGHTSQINRASFSPDGQFVVTASNDSTAIVWETATGNRVAVLRGPPNILILDGSENYVNDASFSPDGKLILTASKDGAARLWELNVEIDSNISNSALISLACTRVERNMTEEEWRQYMGTDAYRLTCADVQPLKPAQTLMPAVSPTLQPSPSPRQEASSASQKKS